VAGSDGVDSDKRTHFEIPPIVLTLLIGSSLGGGAGLYGALGPQLEKKAIDACFDNSQTALDVAAQHGEELNELRRLIYDRTANRYTTENSAKDWQEQKEVDGQQDRRLTGLERDIDIMRGRQ
jgi:hypothetical protein